MYFQLFRFVSVLWLLMVAVSVDEGIPITRPGCKESCGNSRVRIPFPFGIGPGCYHDSWCTSNSSQHLVSSIDLKGSPFRFSYDNELVVSLEAGCSGDAYVTLMNRSSGILGHCPAICQAHNSTSNACDGLGCCSIPLDYASSDDWGIDFYRIGSTGEKTDICMKVAVMTGSHTSDDKVADILIGPISSLWQWEAPPLPIVLSYLQSQSSNSHDPFAPNRTRSECYLQDGPIECNVECSNNGCYSLCNCRYGYEGNPYIPYGCQGAGECHGGSNHSILCKITLRVILGLSISLGTVILLLCSYALYRLIRRQRLIKRRAKFFKRNGGLLLQQQMTTAEGAVERTKVFTAKDLEKATDNFNANRVLGQGGQGTVYKGMLPDGQVVAIKKSKKVDEGQLEQFINEVVILSQINHRNVVKLLGCCLETEVPLLVYEFIPNGTLSQLLNNPSEDFFISWKMRLQIAAESAGAVAYLHSSSGTPIYHRDIKSSNILLDEKYRAKVSDFGCSRSITIDQTHLTTCVQGTFGYFDPEYFQSHQFTEKSDVYSFGVVLIELLTSKKPLSPTESGGWKSLAMEFFFHMENSSLYDILDTRVAQEAKEEEIMSMANLAKRCLNLNGKQRPTMKAVAMALEGITSPCPCEAVELNLKASDVEMKISMMQGDYANPITFCSESGIGASCSIEIQPLMHNTV